jgi:hypothetical protein
MRRRRGGQQHPQHCEEKGHIKLGRIVLMGGLEEGTEPVNF